MLFDSTVRRELARGFGATLVVILTIVLTSFLIRTVGQAASGAIAPAAAALTAVAFAVAAAAAAAVCDALELLREVLRDGWWYGGTLCAILKAVRTSLALCNSRSSGSHVLSPSAS